MVKPPAVYTAGLLRGIGRGIDTTSWAWLASGTGQRLFMPPNVAGWDDERWLDTATFRGRWWVANYASQPYALTDKQAAALPAEPAALVDAAIKFWGSPTISAPTRGALVGFAQQAIADADESWKQEVYPVLIQNALRQLIPVSPDYQTS